MASPPLLVIFHSGDYDRLHHGLSIAAAAVAMERPVELVFVWWALDRLLDDRLDAPDLGEDREEVADRFEARNLPTLRTLLDHLTGSGLCTRIGCTGSLAILGREPEAPEAPHVDLWLGWSAILQRTAGITDRFTL